MNMKKRFSEEQIITILKEAEAGVAIKELLAEAMLDTEALRAALNRKY